MKLPWAAGRVLEPDEFENYCQQVMADCNYCDLRPEEYREGLADFPLLLKPGVWPKLAKVAEKATKEILAAEQELLARPDLYKTLGLPAGIRKVMEGCNRNCWPRGAARVMRFDFHFTTQGWKFSEANPDGPSGYIEAYGFTGAMAPYYPHFTAPPNPGREYAKAIAGEVGRKGLVGVVCSIDRAPIREAETLSREFKKRGMKPILVQPRRLVWRSNFAQILGPGRGGTPDLVVRLAPAERLPQAKMHAVWQPWFCGGKTLMSPPGTAILIESKRFPLVWKELATPMSTWKSSFPESRCPREVAERSETDWVFKPTFGAAGTGTVIAGVSGKSIFRQVAQKARRNPFGWIAQRRFESLGLETERGLGHVCLGIFTVNGLAAGAYARVRATPLIDSKALSIPVLVPEWDLGPGDSESSALSDKNFNKS
jgi:hypothetical protein